MYDFLTQNSLYVVLIIAVICWTGIFLYLLRLDRKLSALEHRGKEIRQ
ncbi:MAG: CcmD family protein [Ignavibacteria bacterium]|nr:MAG: CcmD family protein [Ignavibacteria bacterium]HYQ86724.1 CcmD family protein [Bacteroidota bacterium]